MVFFALLFQWPLTQIYGQGFWVEQLTGSGTGNHLFNRGDDCVGYAKENSQSIFFYDIYTHNWLQVNFENPQVFHKIEAKGRVIIAYTDDYLIGYSSIKSDAALIPYEGDIINAVGAGMSRGFGCSDKLGFFVTDSHFYVFDGVEGEWKDYPYTLFPDFIENNGTFISANDYIGIVLPDNPNVSDAIINMAYSLPNHNFAFKSEGGYYIAESFGFAMSHGFVTQKNIVDDNIMHLIGYSTFTNEFAERNVGYEPFGSGVTFGGWFDYSNISSKSAAVFITTTGDESQQAFAFSTFSGLWYEAPLYHNQSSETAFSNFTMGGSVGAAFKSDFETYETTYVVFDSESGAFHTINSLNNGLNDYINGVGPACGGNSVLASDSSSLWFYTPSGFESQVIEGFAPDLPPEAGDNYLAVTTWDTAMALEDIVFVYNGLTGQVSGIFTGYINQIYYPVTSPDMFGFTAGPTNSTVFLYSALTDLYEQISFPENSFVNIDIGPGIAYISNSGGAIKYLYDGYDNSVEEVAFDIDFYKLGGRIALFTKGSTAYAYNFDNKIFSEIEVDGTTGAFWAGREVGLVGNLSKTYFYAFNGYYGNWIPLFPEGESSPYAVAGDQIALVVRSDRVYAFDPDIIIGITDPASVNSGFDLMQNYPNPFNGTTEIIYQTGKPGHVTLSVYDQAGKEIIKLIDQYVDAGEHHLQFNAGAFSDGVYYYRMTFNGSSKTLKMVLEK